MNIDKIIKECDEEYKKIKDIVFGDTENIDDDYQEIEEDNYKKYWVEQEKNKRTWLKYFPELKDNCGIYVLTRHEAGFHFAYVGQARKVLTRLAQHLSGFQHIDFSLRKHGIKSDYNPSGWQVMVYECREEELDAKEQFYIKQFAEKGFQLRNKTAGGQGKGKVEIAETKPKKTYYNGLKQGRKNTQKEIVKLFEKNLTFTIQGKETKNKLKAYQKFVDFLQEN